MARLSFHWGKHSTVSLWDAVCRQFPKVERASLGNFPAVPFLLTSTNKRAGFTKVRPWPFGQRLCSSCCA